MKHRPKTASGHQGLEPDILFSATVHVHVQVRPATAVCKFRELDQSHARQDRGGAVPNRRQSGQESTELG